ncbi:cation:proton antiporter [Flavobacterium pectinovorum]|uniref:Kef-type K+ transport system, membrane component KefB n=1 Tax=Flavobacterium pectinovorum TaxID=29533 RepID=A0AB36P7C6_9FLAO|nr:cation:proton antiporter [Flavobacterium pectinovorum]OXB08205.1 sodium:proton antiporter [Flavobacterium pectinovorum]SHN14914.1 Kef-type K+ transport system, membrane component KefB [Flavobacterium pectinovorum]
MLLSIQHVSLPIEDPVLKFLIELIIILCIPLLLNKIKVPHLLGLIIAGAVIGPNGFNVLARDSSIVVTGTTGLLYIMFLAGLEIDMGDFKKNKWKSITFSLYTFIVPFALGLIGGYYILHFSLLTSVLFASLFSSHTLIVYPMVSKLGIAKKLAVNVTVGGTMITDVLSLVVLAVVVGMSQGEVGTSFWVTLSASMLVFALVVLLLFPIIARWFFKNVEDKISQYIFVIVMIYLAALLAELAGIEAIIGAFFAGLALNRLIPHTSSLMNRVEFVGNAIFIPFFLISVGMLIDFNAFIQSWETLGVASIMLIASIGGKYAAAILTKKTFNFTDDEGRLIFGMSAASAAATLASVMVGYNIILSENEAGEPVRLLNEHVLNGSILLILVSCTISSFVSMASAQRIADADKEETAAGTGDEEEKILLAVNHEHTVEKMVNLGLLIKNKSNKDKIFALNVINEEKSESSSKNAEKLLGEAVNMGAAADVKINPITRHDNDVIAGVNNVVKEQNITDLIIGLEEEKGFSTSFIYNLYNGYLQNKHINLIIYHAVQPVSTIKKYVVLIPADAEREPGFFHCLLRIWNIGKNSGAKMSFYANDKTLDVLKSIIKKANIEAVFNAVTSWQEAENMASSLEEDEGLIILMADRGMHSYFPQMKEVPEILNKKLHNNNYLLIYPFSKIDNTVTEKRSVSNLDDFADIGKIIGRIFK